MSPKAVLTLAAVALISSGLAFWAVAGRDLALSSSMEEVALAPGLVDQMGHVARVQVTHGGVTTTIEKKGAGWVVDERGGYPADADKVAALARAIASTRLVEPKTDQTDRLPRLELGDPDDAKSKSFRVVLQDGQGKPLVAIVVGKERYGMFGPGRAGSYLRLDGQNRAWLADRRIEVPSETTEWMPREILDIRDDRIARISLPSADGNGILIGRAKAGDELVLEAVPEGRQADADKIDRLASTLSSLTLQDVRAAADMPLPADAPTARFETVEGIVIAAQVLRQGEGDAVEFWVSLVPSAGSPLPDQQAGPDAKPLETQVAELHQQLDGWVFKLPRYTAERMLWSKDDLTKPAGKTS